MDTDQTTDFRYLQNGIIIPTESYSDQPYIVMTNDGYWLCCVTTACGKEGTSSQFVMTLRSKDQGKTWQDYCQVEPPDGPEASYAVMLKAPSGRIYIFYNHNTDRVKEVKCHDDTPAWKRVDSLGHFVFKFSDDNGISWSRERYDIPVRLFECDRNNVYKGDLCFFWNVGKAFAYDDEAYVPLHKVGKMGRGFFDESEGCLLHSPNLMTEADPNKIVWNTLPEGDVGLRTPPGGGPVSEEHSFVVLSDGSFYCIYRSIDGFIVESYSRDKGRSWSTPRYMEYAHGRKIKHPRAATFVWKSRNGKYLCWYHNCGGRFIGDDDNAVVNAYNDRNPVWLAGGVEADSVDGKIILWSQGEIMFYEDDPFMRMSYPDFIEDQGKYYFTATQKNLARTNCVPSDLVENIWIGLETYLNIKEPLPRLQDNNTLYEITDIPVLPYTINAVKLPELSIRNMEAPDHRSLNTRNSFAIEFVIRLNSLAPASILDGIKDGAGIAVNLNCNKCLELVMNDSWMEHRAISEPLEAIDEDIHVVINVDGGARIISFVINGILCDGGDFRMFGWTRFCHYFRNVNAAEKWVFGRNLDGSISNLKIYPHYLRNYTCLTSYKLLLQNFAVQDQNLCAVL